MKVGADIRAFEAPVKKSPPQREIPQNIERLRGEKTKRVNSDQSSTKGVIRNLQEGHFKGVADVRLRMNFQTELMAIQQENGSTLVQQTAVELTTTVGSNLESWTSESQLDEQQASAVKEAFTQFETDVANVIADFSDPQTAFENLRSNADTFLATIKQLMSTDPITGPFEPEIESGTGVDDSAQIENGAAVEDGFSVIDDGTDFESIPNGEIVPATTEEGSEVIEPATDDVDRSTGLFDELARQINELFDNLQLSLLETGLPAPVHSNGGGAFDKFMAIYRGNQ